MISKMLSACVLSALVVVQQPATAQVANLDTTLRVIYNDNATASSPTGDRLTVDVFWCSGDDKANDRALLASELAGSYATLAKVVGDVAPYVSQIRTRPIDKSKFFQNLQPGEVSAASKQPLIDVSSSDEVALRVADILAKSGVNQASVWTQAVSFSPKYLAAYVCQDVDISKYSGQLYFQVRDASQKAEAIKAASNLSSSFPGLWVAKGIEVVGDKSPRSSELRFFFEADRNTATSVADQIEHATGDKLQPKLVAGYAEKIRPGTFEAWIASSKVSP